MGPGAWGAAAWLLTALLLLGALPGPAAASSLSQAGQAYQRARRAYLQLSRSRRMRRNRKNWLRVIQGFRKVYLTYPDDPDIAPRCLYMMGRTYEELYGYSRRKKDLHEAIERYEVLAERFPEHRLTANALYALGRLYLRKGEKEMALDAWGQLLEEFPKSRFAALARRRVKGLAPATPAHRPPPEPAATKRVAVKGWQWVRRIRYWTQRDYTRVVVDTSGPVRFHTGVIPADRRHHRPSRYFVDISPARLAKGARRTIAVRDGLLQRIRLAQYRRNTVRMVLDLQRTRRVQGFFMENPFRIVVDAFGEHYARRTCPTPKAKAEAAGSKAPRVGKRAAARPRRTHHPKGQLSLAQQLGLCVRSVVIDAGHGGKDPGAIGPTGLREKDVTLRLAKRVAAILERDYGMKVHLTRTTDRFIPLERRTAIANGLKADLFVSIHINSARNRRLRGVETYFLNFALDESAMRVAARENAMSRRRLGELRSILTRIMKNAKVKESSRLAASIQEHLVSGLKRRYSGIKNLGVKQAPFFVLVGAQMPAALVEVSFISNRREERRLRDPAYLDAAARGIAKGIAAYAARVRYAAYR